MSSSRKVLKVVAGVGCFVLLVAGMPVGAAQNAPSAKLEKAGSCAAPEYRQFDFWVGDWEVFEIGGQTPVAEVTVDRILDGCVLREQYSGADGHKGQSFTIYDATRKVWHQSWVTNRGELLTIEGGLQGGGIVMEGTDRTADGKNRRVRGEWKPVTEGVRETAVRSLDGGKTWQPWFDLMFRRAANSGKGGNSASELQKKSEDSQP